MNNRHKIIRRTSKEGLASNSSHTPAQVDPAVIDEFVKLQDPVVTEYTHPTLEEFMETRHNLKLVDYSPELLWIVEAMKDYVNVMSVGSNSTQQEHGVQVGRLNLAFLKALRDSDAVVLFDALLWFVSFYHDEAFRAELPFRGTHLYKFGTDESHRFYTHLVSISQELADVRTRHQRLKELDFRGAVNNIPKTFEKQRAGLASFVDYYTNF